MEPSPKMGVYRCDAEWVKHMDHPTSKGPGWFHFLIHRWFVEYNPLYFFSALCILTGVMLASGGLTEIGWKWGQLILAIVVQAYELLLIAGAALLFRAARQKRPAVILGLTAVVFLFDWTFRTESMGTFAHVGSPTACVWALMVPPKLLLLCWVFHLRIRLPLILLPSLAAAGIALAPHILIGADGNREAIHLAATWLGAALAAAVSLLRPRLETHGHLTEWGRTVIRRAGRAIWAIWGGLYAAHLVAWSVQFSVPVGPAHAVPVLLLFALLVRKKGEEWIWAGCTAAVLISTTEPWTTAPTALIAGIPLVVAAWETRRHRLLVGAVLALRLAVLTVGWQARPLPESTLLGAAVTLAVLVGMGVLLRLPSAFIAAALISLPVAWRFIPRNSLEWGTSLLTMGFIALILGVAINWDKRHAAAPPGRS